MVAIAQPDGIEVEGRRYHIGRARKQCNARRFGIEHGARAEDEFGSFVARGQGFDDAVRAGHGEGDFDGGAAAGQTGVGDFEGLVGRFGAHHGN